MVIGIRFMCVLIDGVKTAFLNVFFFGFQAEGIIEVKVKFICLDSTTVKVHPDACGALKKMESNRQKSRRT